MLCHVSTTWIIRLAVIAFLAITVFALCAHSIITPHDHHASTPICEMLDVDDFDEVRPACVSSSYRISSPLPMTINTDVIILRHLSPIIYQPPEVA